MAAWTHPKLSACSWMHTARNMGSLQPLHQLGSGVEPEGRSSRAGQPRKGNRQQLRDMTARGA
eukprot:CAMPEP_0171092100 /NCGR_PEP_ID=MMETSP0766_2-20121228/35502_1 /TAXON_ID=439317 /ORGANISM="Gambierdiscus australes, Strain CAWD 149" /LENGTH=62 /DNA_ID=CAMNT_0011550301 /DNA_START=74 /DNA_END=258 /DNA_ORIENTATION=+